MGVSCVPRGEAFTACMTVLAASNMDRLMSTPVYLPNTLPVPLPLPCPSEPDGFIAEGRREERGLRDKEGGKGG